MFFNRLLWFGAGAMAGVFAARLLTHKESRELLKSWLGGSLSMGQALRGHIELLREDFEDLLAEARHALAQKQGDDAAAAGLDSAVAAAHTDVN